MQAANLNLDKNNLVDDDLVEISEEIPSNSHEESSTIKTTNSE